MENISKWKILNRKISFSSLHLVHLITVAVQPMVLQPIGFCQIYVIYLFSSCVVNPIVDHLSLRAQPRSLSRTATHYETQNKTSNFLLNTLAKSNGNESFDLHYDLVKEELQIFFLKYMYFYYFGESSYLQQIFATYAAVLFTVAGNFI